MYGLVSTPSARATEHPVQGVPLPRGASRTPSTLTYIGVVNGEPKDLDLELTRTELERIVRPVKKTEVFTTAADMQTAVTIHVY